MAQASKKYFARKHSKNFNESGAMRGRFGGINNRRLKRVKLDENKK